MYNQYSFSYDSVSSITKLIDSNQISILKEKVYRNCRYLEFGETCWRKESDQSSWRKDLIYLKKLFEIIKNDFKFYRNFFKIQRYYYSSPIYTGSNKIIKYLLELKKSNSPSSTSLETSLNNTDFGEKSIGLDEIPKNDNIFKGLLCYLNNIGNDNNNNNSRNCIIFLNCITNIFRVCSHNNFINSEQNFDMMQWFDLANQRQIIDKIQDLKKQIQTTINNNNKKDNKTFVSFYFGKNYPLFLINNFNYEVLNLCLVSKEWYFLISPLISYEIIKDHGEDIIMDKWFRKELYQNQYIEQFKNVSNINNSIESIGPSRYLKNEPIYISVLSISKYSLSQSLNKIFKLIINKNWSIIKIKKEIISDFFSNNIIIIKSYGKNYPDTEKYNNFKRVSFICVNEMKYEATCTFPPIPNRQLLSEIACLNKPLGVELKFWKKLPCNSFIDKYFYSLQFIYCFCKFDNFNKVIELKIDGLQFSHLVNNDLTQLKHLKLYSCPSSLHASTLQPGALISLNKRCPTLKTLAIQVPFHLINKHYHGCKITKQCFNGDNLSKNISKEWNELIVTLSNNTSIVNLTISNFPCEYFLDPIKCYEYSNLELNENTIKCISDGFYNLIKNNKTIKFLRLINIDCSVSPNSFSALLFNSTIKTLVINNFSIGPSFSTSIIEYLFSDIFSKNDSLSSSSSSSSSLNIMYNYSSIRRIKFSVDKTDLYSNIKWISFILNCMKKYPNTTLYSIQLPIDIFDNYDDVISLFQSPNSISINELILDFPYHDYYRIVNKRQIIDKIQDLKKQIQATINNNKSENKTLVSFYFGKNYPPLEEFS
ncbi:hypothetical protein ACTFIT_002019 [Dictyostelium discoideum]